MRERERERDAQFCFQEPIDKINSSQTHDHNTSITTQFADCVAPGPCYNSFKLALQKPQPRQHQIKMQTYRKFITQTHGMKSIKSE